MRYIAPAQPKLRTAPPRGDGWLHEVKFDGWRVQLHKERGMCVSKQGHDLADRFPSIATTLASVYAHTIIIDGELTACDDHGLPNFRELHLRHMPEDQLCVWAFDLLHVNGMDTRTIPLVSRQQALHLHVLKVASDRLRFSESFDDGLKLLVAAERMGLEGIVSKRRDAPYRSGRQCEWIKVKCPTWRVLNRERWRLFERER
jgi:bifunctional non-homologous end joining protein LigD